MIHIDGQKGFKDFKWALLGISRLTRPSWTVRHSTCSPGTSTPQWWWCLLGLCVLLGSPKLPFRSSWDSSSFGVSTACCQLTWLKLCFLWLRTTTSTTSGFIKHCHGTQDLKCCSQDNPLSKTSWFSWQRRNRLVFRQHLCILLFLMWGELMPGPRSKFWGDKKGKIKDQ